MKIKLEFIFSILLIPVLLWGAVSVLTEKKEETPKANRGFLDLSGYHFAGKDPIALDGEWEFVPGSLVDTAYFNREGEGKIYVPVPSLWSKYKLEGQKVPLYTSASYRLRIKLPDNNQVWGIKTTNIRMSNAIYANGELIGHSGMPERDRSSYMPHNTPYVAYFHNGDDQLELVVHAANFDYASGGGIVASIYLGDADSINRFREKAMAYDFIMMASLMIMGLYFLGFYAHLRRDIHLLFFSLFCFAMVCYSATHGEKILHLMFQAMPYGLFLRLQGISTLLIGLFLLLYFHFSLKPVSAPKAVKGLTIAGILLVCSMFLPIRINSMLEVVCFIYLIMIILTILFIQVRAILNRTTGSVYLILGTFTMILYFLTGTLNLIANLNINALPPFVPYIYLLMLSLFMAHRFADTFNKNKELSELLIRADQFKDEFLAKTSHEFRTPLHGMIAILQSMLSRSDSGSLTKKQSEKVNWVVDIAKRLSALVNDILDLSKLKYGELSIEIKNVDLFTNTYMVTEVFSYMLQKKIEIKNSVSRDLPYVRADENRLRQILYNLIDNAIKHTEQGVIEITAYEKNGFITVSVKDPGYGIERDKLESIFDPYRQSGTLEQNKQGIGLGLSISKHLVELQGGEIWAESEPDKGSSFIFRIPSAPAGERVEPMGENIHYGAAHEQTGYSDFPVIAGDPEGKKVIIADDDDTNLKVLIETLEPEGYYIIGVNNGADVLKQLTEHADVDLILLDIMMPGMSGYETCQKIRETYTLPELPVLMLTAAILPADMVAAFQSGANDFLHKPFDSVELKARISNLIMLKQSARRAVSMEVAFLQAQIKPHFLYNVLNSILSLSYMDIDKTRSMITSFAAFLRGSFDFSNTNRLVTLEKELFLVHTYVEIEKARYPEQFTFELEKETGINCLIPTLLLQPIVENAIRHGVIKKGDNGKVKLTIQRAGKMAVFKIEDNGAGMSEEQVHQIFSSHDLGSVGLLNISKRIHQLPEASFLVKSEPDKGTTITITIPYYNPN
ncbi:hybrid sensor histidine kinase/response regulator [Paenibacillus abyssi]|uniref:histidine kinase n=1 Tax=Paenibacillus abyssi TaxID=1340531 RepID=A0A917G554_9BACL|nr:ATP-binding protein [Paenibacillus abyssi]GGG22281.1 hypothetical protein GCM10010916_43670 [Paenibacillus abyssi]